ncbi:hypothetical protein DE146DRAFT_791929 [Phaeosphaeria sp. MPI-PUGE-AT-0046c]|nr:hypothetical protein DE146DRAFT_791929 [Phaeosphaeria sp. MPI-PUGE-AT-0046c]
MALQPAQPFFCSNIGNSTLNCCDIDNQSSKKCHDLFSVGESVFDSNISAPDYLEDCTNLEFIYGSVLDNAAFAGTGTRPYQRYQVCASLSNMIDYRNQSLLEPNLRSKVQDYVPTNAPSDTLKHINLAVTDCLTATCQNARDVGHCRYKCSAVNLLINSTTPNVRGVHDCLHELCTGNQSSLPYADADVVGIGVFASYIMQCMFSVILWFIFSSFKIHSLLWPGTSSNTNHTSEALEGHQAKAGAQLEDQPPPTHQSIFEDFLEDFHKAQCYFSATIQVAALSYGIFTTNILITFLLIPLATNGVLPVVFTLFLLYKRDRKLEPNVVLLTIVCWLLSSLVYWALYSNVIPINGDLENPQQEYRAYLQFYYKLSALDACGGYSALSVCPKNFRLGRGAIIRASRRIRILTPIIWTFATLCLLAIIVARMRGIRLSEQTHKMLRVKKKPTEISPSATEKTDGHESTYGPRMNIHKSQEPTSTATNKGRPKLSQLVTLHNFFYVLVTMCFLAGIGMQLSLLSIATSLDMMDRTDWSFGQVVAITIWIPPLLAYLYRELDEINSKRKAAKDIKTTQS